MLTKEAILRLKVQGFADAEAAGKGIAAALLVAEQMAARLGAQGGRLAQQFSAVSGFAARAMDEVAKRAAAAASAIGAIGSASARAGASVAVSAAGMKKKKTALDRVRKAAKDTEKNLKDAFPNAAIKLFGEQAVTKVATLGAAAKTVASGIATGFTAAGVAVAAVGAAAYGAFKTMAAGEKVQAVTGSFAKLTEATGGAKATLEALNAATGQSVGNTALMTGANRLLVAGLRVSQQQMSELFNGAVRLGSALGVGATESVERLTLALQKSEVEYLDELGLKPAVTQAIHRYAEANNIAAEDIDAQTRSQIMLSAVTEQMRERLGGLGAQAEAVGSPTARLSKKWNDFLDRMALMVANTPAVFETLESLSAVVFNLADALSPILQLVAGIVSWFAKLVEWVSKAIKAVKDFFASWFGGGQGGQDPTERIFDQMQQNSAPSALASTTASFRSLYGGPEQDRPASRGASPSSGGGAGLTVNMNVPLHDETIDATAARVGTAVARGMRRRIDDVRGGLERGLARGIEEQYATGFGE